MCDAATSPSAQITNISIVKEAMSEGAYLFAELASLGASMKVIDCGGGLGVDYDGTSTDAPASLSYTTQVCSRTLLAGSKWAPDHFLAHAQEVFLSTVLHLSLQKRCGIVLPDISFTKALPASCSGSCQTTLRGVDHS